MALKKTKRDIWEGLGGKEKGRVKLCNYILISKNNFKTIV